MALQHHYGVSKPEARTALASVLSSGVVSPLNGRPVFEALATGRGGGLLDRLIADDYRRAELITLTLDRRMASLPEVQAL